MYYFNLTCYTEIAIYGGFFLSFTIAIIALFRTFRVVPIIIDRSEDKDDNDDDNLSILCNDDLYSLNINSTISSVP